MSFDSLLSDTIDIYRAQPGAGITTSYGDAPYNSGVACLIQPVTEEYDSKTSMNYGREYNCFVPLGTDINFADRVIDEFGKIYQVMGTANRPYGFNVQHLTVQLTEEATQGPDD